MAKTTISRAAFATIGLLLVAGSARAGAGRAESAVTFHHQQKMFNDLNFDTGWVPNASAPIRVRFNLHVGGGAEATLNGGAVLSWPDYYEMSWQGDEDGGELLLDVGVEMESTLAWDLPIIGKGQAPLPIVPSFDLLFEDQAIFDPFLLPGAAELTAHVEDEIQKADLATVDLVPLITGGVPIPGLKAGLILKGGGRFAGDLQGVQIETTTANGQSIIHGEDGARVIWNADGKTEQSGQAAYLANAHFEGSLVLTPGITIQIGEPSFWKWSLAPIDIPIDILNQSFPWQFAPEELDFSVELQGDTDQGSTDADSDADAAVSIDEDSDAGDEQGSDADCACSAYGARQFSPLVAILSALIG